MSKKIAIGGDHAGFEYKAAIIEFLQELGYTVLQIQLITLILLTLWRAALKISRMIWVS